jgi:hypothetical protein
MGLSVWADISLLWLIFLTLIVVLPFTVLFFYATKGMRRLRQLAKQYLPIAQEKARLVADTTEEVSQKVASPIIGVYAKTAQADGLTNAIFTRRKKA